MEKYKVINGTSYDARTPDAVIQVLERARQYNTRIILSYGDIETGQDWNEIYDVTGYVGRSTGPTHIPILVYNSRSHGGGAILDRCIVKIVTSRGKEVLYQAKNYKAPIS